MKVATGSQQEISAVSEEISISKKNFDKFKLLNKECKKLAMLPKINNIKVYQPGSQHEEDKNAIESGNRTNEPGLMENNHNNVHTYTDNNSDFLLPDVGKGGNSNDIAILSKTIQANQGLQRANSDMKNDTTSKFAEINILKHLKCLNSPNNKDTNIQRQNLKQASGNQNGIFSEFHNRNLEVIKKITDKFEAIKMRSLSKEKRETSMDRYNKIKRFFHLKKIKITENEANSNLSSCVNQCLPIPKISNDKKSNQSPSDKATLSYIIASGNNEKMIKRCMWHRINWKECTNANDQTANFIWTPTSSGIAFTYLTKQNPVKQIVNHFEYHSQISNKLNLFLNLMKYCEAKNIDIFTIIPLTVLIQYDSMNYLRQFNAFTAFYNNIEDYIIKSPANQAEMTKKKYKDYFYVDYNEKFGQRTNLYVNANHYVGKNIWIVKAVDLNRGRCIKLADSVEKVQKIIKKFYNGMCREFKECEKEDEETQKKQQQSLPNVNVVDRNRNHCGSVSPPQKNGSPGKAEQVPASLKSTYSTPEKYRSSLVIIQKYIEKPLLYKGRKFDIRMWVLLTHKLEVFAYKEGHLKTSSEKFDISNTNSFVHLTNYSVQKYNHNFSKYEYGNEISFLDFQKALYADQNYASVKYDIFPKMCEIIKTTMKCVKDKINILDRRYCFEIFGYDFIFDCDLNPMLLEINTNPGLEDSSPWIEIICPRMVDDALRLTIDETFGAMYSFGSTNPSEYESPFPVDGYTNHENLWEFVCSLKEKEPYIDFIEFGKSKKNKKKKKKI